MRTDDQGPSIGSWRPIGTASMPWSGPNRSGARRRPRTWPDWMILGALVATRRVIVVLLRTGPR